MIIGTKCQYALRAVFEICRNGSSRVLTIAEISRSQHIPQRYLEAILNQLQKGGLLEAQRGRAGGYRLVREPGKVTLGEVIRLIDGPIRMVSCFDQPGANDCPMSPDCVFLPTWTEVQKSMDRVLDTTTFAQLLEREREKSSRLATDFVI